MTNNKKLKSHEMHDKSPFVFDFVLKTKTKKLTVGKGSALVNIDTGEVEDRTTEICQNFSFDKELFIKVFVVENWDVFSGLSLPAYRTIFFVFAVAQKTPGKDKIFLHPDFYADELPGLSKSAFYRGIEELLGLFILARANVPGWFYLSPRFFFNGNRIRYREAHAAEAEELTPERMAWHEKKELEKSAKKPATEMANKRRI